MFEKLNINYQWRKSKNQMGLLIAYLLLLSAWSCPHPSHFYIFFPKSWVGIWSETPGYLHIQQFLLVYKHTWKRPRNTKCLFISISKYKNLSSSSFRKKLQITSINVLHCSYTNIYKNSFKLDGAIRYYAGCLYGNNVNREMLQMRETGRSKINSNYERLVMIIITIVIIHGPKMYIKWRKTEELSDTNHNNVINIRGVKTKKEIIVPRKRKSLWNENKFLSQSGLNDSGVECLIFSDMWNVTTSKWQKAESCEFHLWFIVPKTVLLPKW